MDAAADDITELSVFRAHVKPLLNQLHWLPVDFYFCFCLPPQRIYTGQTRQYLTDCVSTVHGSSYRLRSTVYGQLADMPTCR